MASRYCQAGQELSAYLLLSFCIYVQEPEASREGMGGTYFFSDEAGRKVGIMKPCDEEPMAPNNPKVCSQIIYAPLLSVKVHHMETSSHGKTEFTIYMDLEIASDKPCQKCPGKHIE